MTLAKLIDKRGNHLYMINFFSTKALQLDEQSSQSEINNRLKKLLDLFASFETIIKELENNSEYDSKTYLEENLKAEELYTTAISSLQSLQIAEDPNQTIPPRQQQQFEWPTTQIEVPPFNGKYEEWRSFEDLFLASVANNRSDAQKLQRLKQLLRGDALNAIRHLPTTNENYTVAMTLLKKRYNNKRAIVNRNLKALFTMPRMAIARASAIVALLNTVNESIQALSSLNIPTDQWDAIVVFLIESKLDQQTHRDWEFHLKGSVEIPSLQAMLNFLETSFRTLESFESAVFDEKKQNRPEDTRKTICSFCDSIEHRIYECPSFTTESIDEKYRFVEKKKLCLNCFAPNHVAAKCLSKFKCRTCRQNHHTLLHKDKNIVSHLATPETDIEYEDGKSSDDEQEDQPKKIQTLLANTFDHVLLATAAVYVREKEGKTTLKARALLDQGSQGCFISEDLVQQLRLKRHKTNISVSGVGKGKPKSIKHIVQFDVLSHSLEFKIPIKAMVIKSVTAIRSIPRMSNKAWEHIQNMELADPQYQDAGCIDLLIGADVFGQLLLEGVKKAGDNCPVAQRTELGWILSGKTSNESQMKITELTANIGVLEERVHRFWQNDALDNHEEEKCDDLLAEQHFIDTCKRDESNRFVVKLPFKTETPPSFVGTRKRAVRRAIQNEVMLQHKPELQAHYTAAMNEYIELGHMKLSEIQGTTDDGYFMPHHAVIKESSSTTKVRPVFDASMQDDNGLSLNDTLMCGPTIQPKLANTLLRWRKFKYVFSTDIEKMYRQVLVDADDAKYQQIVWRPTNSEPFKNFTIERLTFGTVNASFQSIRCIKQLSIEGIDKFPKIARSILSSSYVDDIYMGAEDVNELIALKDEAIEFFNHGGFLLRKWASNSPKLLEELPLEHRELNQYKTVNEIRSIKMLGVQWTPANDEFIFDVNFKQSSSHTKRQYLSQISKIFDPLGFISPFVVSLKIIMQKIHKEKIDWHHKLPIDIQNQWSQIIKATNDAEKMHIDRWLPINSDNKGAALVGFCDASENAYAAVVYLRADDMHGACKIRLISAKTKVAPLNKMTIPRLELNAAMLLADLMENVETSLEYQFEHRFAFGDSMVVQAWVTGPAEKRKLYVQRRVNHIQQKVSAQHWHYVCTGENPADCASRGISLAALKSHDLWWNGPSWLSNPIDEWPICQRIVDTQIETKTKRTKLKDSVGASEFYTLAERNRARIALIKSVQAKYFPEDLRHLTQDKAVSKRSKLRLLHPFLDGNGVIRVGGRLQNSSLPYERKHPIILPPQAHFTVLVMRQAHARMLHSGPSSTLNDISDRYWILNGKNTVRFFVLKCVRCAINTAKVSEQLMGSLPRSRVEQTHPFQHVGIDFAGPIEVRSSELRNASMIKVYIAMFECMACKAVHLETVLDLTALGFIAAFKKFVARRGLCTDVYLDNANNHVGAKNEFPRMLHNALSQMSKDIVNELLKDDITFHFIPPRSPNFGGLWEASIKVMKFLLKRIFNGQSCTVKELELVIIQVEACMNSRPLCPTSSTVSDFETLTPGHFLVGRALTTIPEPMMLAEKEWRLSKWQRVQRLYQSFWSAWSKSYLNELQKRTKWNGRKPNIGVNDLVILRDANAPPCKWIKGRVIRVFPGADGLVRVAEIKTQTGSFRRGIQQICRLPVYEADE